MESDATVLIIAVVNLLIGVFAGLVMHRSDYCIAGMFRDFFLFRDRFMLRTLILLIVCSMVFFEITRHAGLLKYYPFPIIGSPSLTNFLGGIVFGIGMVLAGGCVVGTLYKMGGGSFLSALAFFGLIVGSGIYAEIHPHWALFAKKTSFWQGTVTLPQLLNIDPAFLVSATAIVSLLFFSRWRQHDGMVDAAFAALLHDLRHRRRWRGDQREIGYRRQVAGVRIAALSEHLFVLGVDRIDLARVTRVAQIAEQRAGD